MENWRRRVLHAALHSTFSTLSTENDPGREQNGEDTQANNGDPSTEDLQLDTQAINKK